jgi:histone-lysine N-methyltransferase SETD3
MSALGLGAQFAPHRAPAGAAAADARRGGAASCSYAAPSARTGRARQPPTPQERALGARPRGARPPRARRAAPAAATPAAAEAEVAALDAQLAWAIEAGGLPPTPLEPAALPDRLGGARAALVAARAVRAGEPLLAIPGDLAVTAADVEKDAALAALAAGRGELVGLALWLLAERGRIGSSPWAPLLAALPRATESPLLWPDAERAELLRGSPTLAEARAREAALRAEWAEIAATAAADPAAYPPAVFNEDAFLAAMSVVLARAAFLPAAGVFALLPLVGALARTGAPDGAALDYDPATGAAVLVAGRDLARGEAVALADGRPNGELLLATGDLEDGNPADCQVMTAALVPADRLYAAKKEVLEALGFGTSVEFPVFEDRLSVQHLAFARLARVADAAQLAKITFEADVIVSVENEYEVLQLMMGDLRERQQGYAEEYEAEVKNLQRPELGARERLAARLRLGEKRVLRGTMDGVRRRLAPIRGVPTKKGMEDPNADFKEIFDAFEAIPAAPKKLFDGIAKWARGDNDPTWKKKR